MKLRSLEEVKKEFPDFKPGWKRGEGDVVLENSKLGRLQAVVVCEDDGTPKWDQFTHIEPVGAITIVMNRMGKIGLIQSECPVVIAVGKTPNFPDINLENHGRQMWETPRGFPKKGEMAEETAKREAGEEFQSPVRSIRKLGEVNANPAFYAHCIPVYLAVVDSDWKGEIPKDVNEKILKVEYHDRRTVKAMLQRGFITCALSRAALAFVL